MAVPPHWTKPQLTTLIHALLLSPPDAPSLLPYTAAQITSTIRTLSRLLQNPSSWTTPRHTRALLHQLTGLSPPAKPRRKKPPPAPKHRVSIQLIPSSAADHAAVNAVAYPFVEVVLKPNRRVWDIVRHLYRKWGLPVRVLADSKHVPVDSLVVELLDNHSRVVRLPYKVLNVDINWRLLDAVFEQPVVRAPGRRRVTAPRDDDAFWTGGSPAKPPSDPSPPVKSRDDTALDPGEQRVLQRLRGHLERLERQENIHDDLPTSPILRSQEIDNDERDAKDNDDLAIIPEHFLRSCSRYDLAHSLPESLLSLGRSDESHDAGGFGEKGDDGGLQATGKQAQAQVQVQAQEETQAQEHVQGQVEDAGNAENHDIEVGVDVNALQVMNDALDLRHDLDLRCDEDLGELDFLPGELGDVPAPSLSLSALFRD